MNKKIKIGMIGFGGRGISLLRSSVLPSCGDEYDITPSDWADRDSA